MMICGDVVNLHLGAPEAKQQLALSRFERLFKVLLAGRGYATDCFVRRRSHLRLFALATAPQR